MQTTYICQKRVTQSFWYSKFTVKSNHNTGQLPNTCSFPKCLYNWNWVKLKQRAKKPILVFNMDNTEPGTWPGSTPSPCVLVGSCFENGGSWTQTSCQILGIGVPNSYLTGCSTMPTQRLYLNRKCTVFSEIYPHTTIVYITPIPQNISISCISITS